MTYRSGTGGRLDAFFPSVRTSRPVPAQVGTGTPEPPRAQVPPPKGGTGAGATPSLGLIEVLDALALAGIGFDLDHSEPRPVLVFEPPLVAEAEALIEPVRVELTYVALGRYTGHAPAVCDVCGWVTMLSLVNAGGTSRGAPSVGWPRCLGAPRCPGRRVIREADRFGVRRVRHRPAPRASS